MAINYSRGGGDPAGLQIIDPVLSNVARQFVPHGFIYGDLVAYQPVEMHIGQYPIFNPASFFGNSKQNNQVADDATTPIVDIQYSTEFYKTKNYRLKTRLTNEELNQANPALRIELSKVKNLMSNMAVEKEVRLATSLRSSKAGGQLTGGKENGVVEASKKWNEPKEAVIQEDIQKAKKEVRITTGYTPNTLVITQTIAEVMAANPKLQELIKYVMGPKYLELGDGALPAKLFGLNVVIADGAFQNTGVAGSTPTLQEIWGSSYCRVLYVDKGAGWGMPSVAYSFRGKVASDPSLGNTTGAAPGSITQAEPDGSGAWAVVDRWVEPDPPAQNIRAWENVDEKIVAPELGIEITEIA